tara:strand:+ start:4659 stop:8081 length:3423 start_codon:yes stop_codon:yes gene_type:complete
MALELTPELAEKLQQETVPEMPSSIELQMKGMSGLNEESEDFSLGFDQDAIAQSARVTGLGDGAEAVFGDTILTTAITGFNRGLANLVDPVIYNAAVAFRKIGEQAGLPFLANIKPDRNEMARIFASGDFETQNIMSNVLGIPINYGEGADIGVTDEEGLASEFVYGGGKFLGEGAPIALGTQLAANLATKGIASYGTNVLGPKIAPATAPKTYMPPGQGKPLGEIMPNAALQGPSNLGQAGTFGQKAYQKFDEFVTPRQTTTNVIDDIIRTQATNPGQMAALETGISGLAGGVTEATDSPTLGILSAFAPAALPAIVGKLPSVTAFKWIKGLATSDIKEVALGTKSAVEGQEGAFLKNKAQKMIQDQLKLEPEKAKAAADRFEEIVAKIPELRGMAPGQVFNNQALIKTFDEALETTPNDQIPAMNALLDGFISGATKFKSTIGIEGADTGVTGNNLLILDNARKTFDLSVEQQAKEITAADDFLQQQGSQIAREGSVRQTDREKFQAGLNKRVEDAKEAVDKEKVRLGIVKEKRPIKQATGKREKTLVKADDLVEPETVLALQKRVLNEIVPAAGVESAGFKKLPPSIRDLVEWDSSKPYSFRDWLLAREEVSAAISKGSAFGSPEVPTLMQYRDMLDDFSVGAFKNLGPKYREFIDFAKKTLYDPFERSLIMGVAAKDKTIDRYLTQGEQVTKTFLKNEPEVLRRFVETVTNEAPEVNDLKNVLLDSLYDKAYKVDKGAWDETALNKWMGDNRNYLELLPGRDGKTFLDELTDTQALLQKSLQRRKTATDRKKEIEGTLLGRFLQAQTKKGTLEPEEDFLTQLVTKPTKEGGERTMLKTRKDFLNSDEAKAMGETNAENVFRRTIFEKLDQEQKIMNDPAAFKAWLQEDKNTQLLKDAGFSETHMKDLYLLADASERINTIPRLELEALGAEGTIKKIATALGTSTAAVSTRVLAVKENRISPRTAFIYLASRAIGAQNEIRMNALMREAITDPQLAKMLTTELPETNPLGRIPGPIIRKVNNYLVGSGVEAGEEIKEEMNRGITFPASEEQLRNFIDRSGPPVPEAIEERRRIDNAPPFTPTTSPELNISQVAPSPTPASTGGGQVKVSSLFPFDPLSAAIQERQQQKQGIGSLMG